ncbi:metallophosphoesterase [Terriglobus sp. TAA 43]|uniref:metallophosphoesterase n=1 Tax=Terriglobus sp. TAA 43 TaxID=278961 RepID=UPI000647C587|nr:metallophosphoesterase [Terriglobus sp. TAA 43]
MSSRKSATGNLTRRRFLAGATLTAGGLALYSGEIERHVLMTVERTIHIRNLPAPFHGFRIAQLSDFHFHDYDESFFVRHAIQKVNELAPDMVALTGDFITTSKDEHRQAVPDAYACAEILREIKCPVRFCSLGNHDVSIKADVADALRRNGLTLLMNQFTTLEKRGERIWVSGIADAYFDVPNLALAMPKRKTDEPIVLLGHEPDFADTIASQNYYVDLMLAGHTHGGQVRLPFLPPILLPAMGEKYVEGLHTVGSSGMQVYVNRGLGCMHLPFRFNCPPELTLLTLQPA